MKLAFKDSFDGYYEYDSPDGSIPDWAKNMIPCAIQVPAITPVPLKQQAQTALDKVTGPSGTIIRCVAAGVAVPTAWSAYVLSLRSIANGTDTISTTLPTQPAYPAGT